MWVLVFVAMAVEPPIVEVSSMQFYSEIACEEAVLMVEDAFGEPTTNDVGVLEYDCIYDPITDDLSDN